MDKIQRHQHDSRAAWRGKLCNGPIGNSGKLPVGGPAEGEGKSNLFPVFKPDAFRYMKKGRGRRNLPFTVIIGINTDQKILGGFISVMYCEGNFFYRTRFYGRSVFICCINIKERKMETGSIRPSV